MMSHQTTIWLAPLTTSSDKSTAECSTVERFGRRLAAARVIHDARA